MTDTELNNIARIAELKRESHSLWGEILTLRQALKEISADARCELETPTGLHMTCLSIIKKTAIRALGEAD